MSNTPGAAPAPIESFFGKYRFLSNFYPSPIVGKNDKEYPTVEHAFQAAKFPDGSSAHEQVRFAPTPGDAKRLGRTLGPPRADWDEIRVEVMRRLLRLKFYPGSKLANKLEATGDAELVEGNTWGDQFWGVCGGIGENWLGKLLMEHRSQLREIP